MSNREGSYIEAMNNRVDFTLEENNLSYHTVKQNPRSTIEEFDNKVLKTISETSLHSLKDSYLNVNLLESVFPYQHLSHRKNMAYAANLNLSSKGFDMAHSCEKNCKDLTHSACANISSSASCVSDFEDRHPLSLKSFNESVASSKVHFNPVISEVNWHYNTESDSIDKESSCTIDSSPESEISSTPPIIQEKLQFYPPLQRKIASSQPTLYENEPRQEFVQSLRAFRPDFSKSQPDISICGRTKKSGSLLMKKDADGCLVKAYIDEDGIQYKHTHLDLNNVYCNKRLNTCHLVDVSCSREHEVSKPQTITNESQKKIQDETKVGKSEKLKKFFKWLKFSFSSQTPEKNNQRLSQAHQKLLSQDLRLRSCVSVKENYIYIPLKDPLPTSIDIHSKHMKKPRKLLERAGGKMPYLYTSLSDFDACAKDDRNATHQSEKQKENIDSNLRPRPMEATGFIETDLDTEITIITNSPNVKSQSLLNLGSQPRKLQLHQRPQKICRPHKSMDFLLDENNVKVNEPPENQLQKHEKVMSKHQLKVERSLQKLSLPEWYKPSQIPQQGFLLGQNNNKNNVRWQTTRNRTTSLSSLNSFNNQSSFPISSNTQNQMYSKYSSRISSTASSPCASIRSSINAHHINGSSLSYKCNLNFRQPYKGWRSQEKFTWPRTPAERLTNTFIKETAQAQPVSENSLFQNSISEVTSAIVHYVSTIKSDNAKNNIYDYPDSDSINISSANSQDTKKFIWLESSFVGTRPFNTPETPVSLCQNQNNSSLHSANLQFKLNNEKDLKNNSSSYEVKPSSASTTLEDVLDSLLGLPSTVRIASPSLQDVDGVLSISISDVEFSKVRDSRRIMDSSSTLGSNAYLT